MTRTGRRAVDGEEEKCAGDWCSAEAYRSVLSKRLGRRWKVRIIAQRPEEEDGNRIVSVATIASRTDDVRLYVTHDRSADVVLLSLGDGPRLPFEDLAVAKGKMDTGDLIDLGIRALANPPGDPAFDLETSLRLIREWDDELAGDLDPANRQMARKLKEVSDDFETALTLYSKSRE